MTDRADRRDDAAPSPATVEAWLRTAGWVAPVAGVTGGLAVGLSSPSSAAGWLTAAASAGAGFAAGAALMGMALLLLAAGRVLAYLRRLDAAAGSLSVKLDELSGRGIAASHADADRVAGTFDRLREMLLMDEAERRRQVAALRDQQRRAARDDIDARVAAGDLDAAATLADAYRDRFPDADDAAEPARRIVELRRARRLAEADRLAEAAETAARTEQWIDAHRLAAELLDKYPDSPPADFARAGFDTLRRNAGIEIRRRMENDFMDCIGLKNFAGALRIAESFVADYPDSPQAAALRDKLPRLRDQAAGRDPGLSGTAYLPAGSVVSSASRSRTSLPAHGSGVMQGAAVAGGPAVNGPVTGEAGTGGAEMSAVPGAASP